MLAAGCHVRLNQDWLYVVPGVDMLQTPCNAVCHTVFARCCICMYTIAVVSHQMLLNISKTSLYTDQPSPQVNFL